MCGCGSGKKFILCECVWSVGVALIGGLDGSETRATSSLQATTWPTPSTKQSKELCRASVQLIKTYMMHQAVALSNNTDQD